MSALDETLEVLRLIQGDQGLDVLELRAWRDCLGGSGPTSDLRLRLGEDNPRWRALAACQALSLNKPAVIQSGVNQALISSAPIVTATVRDGT